MKIMIPVAGSSEAFTKEGMRIKPLVEIGGRHMIEHIAEMFPKGTDFIFLCKQEDLENTSLPIVLEKAAPNSTIISVEKPTRGSVETVLLADGNVDDEEEIIIHHADSLAAWDFEEFLNIARKAQGCLSVTTGFNPAFAHGKYGLAKVNGGEVVKVIEKEAFALSSSAGYTSAGSYYFASWKLFRKYAEQMIKKNVMANATFFDSLVYNEMIQDGLDVSYYIAKNFISWGEPSSLNEYNFWSEYFEMVANGMTEHDEVYDIINLIPSAGKGKRFVDAGYATPKPMIGVMGKPMILQSALALPKGTKYIFVILREQADSYNLDKFLKENIENCEIVVIDKMTDGMARTCLMAEHLLENKPLIVSSCDYSYVYSDRKFQKTIEEEDPDAMIFTFVGYPDARLAPNAYAYVMVEDGVVKKVSEKVPISDTPNKDPIIQGTFYFRNAETFLWCVKEMIRKGITVNGEYYVATAISQLIEAGKKVVPFELEKYICWGTPLDLKTFEFWENYFSSRADHPYTKQ